MKLPLAPQRRPLFRPANKLPIEAPDPPRTFFRHRLRIIVATATPL